MIIYYFVTLVLFTIKKGVRTNQNKIIFNFYGQGGVGVILPFESISYCVLGCGTH